MPDEVARKTGRKRVYLDEWDRYVWVPVVMEISFIDPADRYQETHYIVDNSHNGSRSVHVDMVKNDYGNAEIQVERIDLWPVLDPRDRGQETEITFDNVSGAELTPPHFYTHLATHVVRYTNEETGDWVESEVIDEFIVLDKTDRAQETYYTLNNPDAQANMSDPDITDYSSIDPPWRTDPFQNIIRWHKKLPDVTDSRGCGCSLQIQIAQTFTDGSGLEVIEYPGDAIPAQSHTFWSSITGLGPNGEEYSATYDQYTAIGPPGPAGGVDIVTTASGTNVTFSVVGLMFYSKIIMIVRWIPGPGGTEYYGPVGLISGPEEFINWGYTFPSTIQKYDPQTGLTRTLFPDGDPVITTGYLYRAAVLNYKTRDDTL